MIPLVSGFFLFLLAAIVLRQRGRRGRAVQPRPAAKPWAAVKVRPQGMNCAAARRLADSVFLASEAPPLPLPGCRAGRCDCRYQYLDDRRQGERRSPITGRQLENYDSDVVTQRARFDRRRPATDAAG